MHVILDYSQFVLPGPVSQKAGQEDKKEKKTSASNSEHKNIANPLEFKPVYNEI